MTDLKSIANQLYTLQDILRWTMSMFNRATIYYGHGTDNAYDEARYLILPSLSLPLDLPETFYMARLTQEERLDLIEKVILRIEQRIPVPYITNKAWFCGLEFYVDERVLIPRSPIGELIEQRFNGLLPQTPGYILDMCTGSGCIAIACAYAFPEAEIDAVDISSDALNVAEYNIEQHQLQHRIVPICTDLFDMLLPIEYDLIIANPPYVDAEDMDTLPQEYTLEPALALEAGEDGLALVERILEQAPRYLSDNGVLICEVGNSMVHLVERYPAAPFNWLTFKRGGEGVFAITKAQLLAIDLT